MHVQFARTHSDEAYDDAKSSKKKSRNANMHKHTSVHILNGVSM